MKIQNVQKFNFNKPNFTSNKTYSILGASSVPKNEDGKNELLNYMQMASDFTKTLVQNGDSIITGCGDKGIMGAAYYSAYNNGSKEQNKVFIMQPEWGDEDKEHCEILGYTTSEAERIQKFKENSDAMVIFPGSCGTMQELTTLISENYYSKTKKPVILVGKKFFEGIDSQYQNMLENGYLSKVKSTDELYKIVDSLDELKETIKEN